MNSTITKLLLSAVLSLGTIGTFSTISNVMSENQLMTEEKVMDVATNSTKGTVEKVVEDHDDYTVYTKTEDAIYEVEVEKWSGFIEDVDKEKIIQTEPDVSQPTEITLEDAKAAALQRQNGTILDTRYDDDDYEIFIQNGDYIYQIDVDRRTGKIDDVDREIVAPEVISRSDAESIALSQVDGTVTSVDYDDDDLQYSVEIRKDFFEYEVEINALSGKVLRVEKDD